MVNMSDIWTACASLDKALYMYCYKLTDTKAVWYYEEDCLEVLSNCCFEVACSLEKSIKDLNALPEKKSSYKRYRGRHMHQYDTILELQVP